MHPAHIATGTSFSNPLHFSPPAPPIYNLNHDSLVYLFSFLELEDLPTIPLVCREWSAITLENSSWKKHLESLLSPKIRAIPHVTLQEKTKIYLKELQSQVNFVLENPDLKIHVYLWSPESPDPFFPTELLNDLGSEKSLLWKTKRIRDLVNSATFPGQTEKVACYKFTSVTSDKDVAEINSLLTAGFDPNSCLSEEQAHKYPTALFTLFHLGLSYGVLEKDTVLQLIKKMIDHGLDITICDSKGKTALDIVRGTTTFETAQAVEQYIKDKEA